jgi:DNA-3-methyladenine glycosylase I
MYRDEKPPYDSSYFENMTRCIFQAGLNWKVVANKWENFRGAFHQFDINKVASFNDDDVDRLMGDTGIIRNRKKILATIQNAKEFRRISEQHESFGRWIESLDKSNNYEKVVKELKSRFKHVGPSTAHIFLYSVGEKIQHDESVHHR